MLPHRAPNLFFSDCSVAQPASLTGPCRDNLDTVKAGSDNNQDNTSDCVFMEDLSGIRHVHELRF